MNTIKQQLIRELNAETIKLISISNKLNTVELSTDDIEIELLANLKNIITIRCNYHLKILSINTRLNRDVTATTFNDVSLVIEIINRIRIKQ